MGHSSLAIIGAGFSGTLLALHLLRRCPPATSVALIERSREHGLGQAYSTGNPDHLLNVPAGRMSAFSDQPQDFLGWLKSRSAEELDGVQPDAGTFVPRRLYGAYVRSLLNEQLKRSDRNQLTLVRANVVRIDRDAHPLVLTLDRGAPVSADLAVLAIGNFPPEPIRVADPGFYHTDLYHADPWAPDAMADLDPDHPVMLLGTGLTMVDVAVGLLSRGHRGPIHALSRRGLLPHRHRDAVPPPASSSPYPPSVTALTRLLRAQAEAAAVNGADWRGVVDALRPFTQDLWQAMSMEDRKRFLRHVRPFWDVHRHRMAGPIADRIEAALARRQLRIQAGRVAMFKTTGDGVEVVFRPRASQHNAAVRVARVVNCTGVGADYARVTDPLVQSLLSEGTARPDPLQLGLDVTASGALRLASGAISRRIFAVGPVTRAAYWEMTAVPDIRRQCEMLAQHLASLVKAPPVIKPAAQRQPTLMYSI